MYESNLEFVKKSSAFYDIRLTQKQNGKHSRYKHIASWWFQPLRKICSSNWIISPRFGVKIPKTHLSCHHLETHRHSLSVSSYPLWWIPAEFTRWVWPLRCFTISIFGAASVVIRCSKFIQGGRKKHALEMPVRKPIKPVIFWGRVGNLLNRALLNRRWIKGYLVGGFQPNWKMCSSIWISPRIGVEIQKNIFELPPPRVTIPVAHSKRPFIRVVIPYNP